MWISGHYGPERFQHLKLRIHLNWAGLMSLQDFQSSKRSRRRVDRHLHMSELIEKADLIFTWDRACRGSTTVFQASASRCVNECQIKSIVDFHSQSR